jgi:dephospho-CoA kinase
VTTPVEVVALTGTIGVGKTTIAGSISRALHDMEVRHALLDLDWLGQVYPVPEGHDPFGYELAIQNLGTIWPNFLEVGITRAVVSGTILNVEQLGRLCNALAGSAVTVVLVAAPSDLVKQRIRGRTTGPLLDDFLSRTDAVADEILRAAIHDIIVSNDARPPREVAHEVMHRVNWP